MEKEERLREILRVASDALKEISEWDQVLEDKWVSRRIRALYALDKIELIDQLTKLHKK